MLVNCTVDSSDVFDVLASDTGVMLDEGDKVTGIDSSGVGDETSATFGFDHLVNPQTPRPSA